MHEVSIAQNILEIAETEALNSGAKVINEIELDIGTVSGIEINSLTFALESLKTNPMLKNAVIKINRIKAEGVCNDCSESVQVQSVWDKCFNCGSYNLSILKGRELQVKSLNVD